MFKKIALDHCYNEDNKFAFFKKLGKSGFNLESDVVEHPGKAFCKFIALQSNNKRERFYLEFVHIGKGGIFEYTPGLSFNYISNLEGFSKSLNKKVPCTVVHKNYEWRKNSIDRLPGWNMLNFKKMPIKNIYTWFTEYESSENQRNLKKVKDHPNSVYSIHGIQLTLTAKGKGELEKVLSKKLDKKTKLSDGTYLYIKDGKRDQFETIILNCKSFKKFKKFVKKPEMTIFDGVEAIAISNNSSNRKDMWDLRIIEN
jgi:hypothetical protein